MKVIIIIMLHCLENVSSVGKPVASCFIRKLLHSCEKELIKEMGAHFANWGLGDTTMVNPTAYLSYRFVNNYQTRCS